MMLIWAFSHSGVRNASSGSRYRPRGLQCMSHPDDQRSVIVTAVSLCLCDLLLFALHRAPRLLQRCMSSLGSPIRSNSHRQIAAPRRPPRRRVHRQMAATLPLSGTAKPAPRSCDTFVALPDATADGSVVFGKNSDRPTEVSDVIERQARGDRSGSLAMGRTLQTGSLPALPAPRTCSRALSASVPRPLQEAQEVVYFPAAEHTPGSSMRCTYIEIPQAPRTHAVVRGPGAGLGCCRGKGGEQMLGSRCLCRMCIEVGQG